jgi:hypothetical protein
MHSLLPSLCAHIAVAYISTHSTRSPLPHHSLDQAVRLGQPHYKSTHRLAERSERAPNNTQGPALLLPVLQSYDRGRKGGCESTHKGQEGGGTDFTTVNACVCCHPYSPGLAVSDNACCLLRFLTTLAALSGTFLHPFLHTLSIVHIPAVCPPINMSRSECTSKIGPRRASQGCS